MKRLLRGSFNFLVALIVMSVPLSAQDVPSVDGFGGFSLLIPDVDNSNRTTLYGWQAGAAANITSSVGIVGDFGGQYKDGLRFYEYMGGVRFSARGDRATGFVHALFGGIHGSDGGGSDNGYLMGYGGGVDVNAGDRIAIRVVQFDWLPVRFDRVWNKSLIRFGFGIVFKGSPR